MLSTVKGNKENSVTKFKRNYRHTLSSSWNNSFLSYNIKKLRSDDNFICQLSSAYSSAAHSLFDLTTNPYLTLFYYYYYYEKLLLSSNNHRTPSSYPDSSDIPFLSIPQHQRMNEDMLVSSYTSNKHQQPAHQRNNNVNHTEPTDLSSYDNNDDRSEYQNAQTNHKLYSSQNSIPNCMDEQLYAQYSSNYDEQRIKPSHHQFPIRPNQVNVIRENNNDNFIQTMVQDFRSNQQESRNLEEENNHMENTAKKEMSEDSQGLGLRNLARVASTYHQQQMTTLIQQSQNNDGKGMEEPLHVVLPSGVPFINQTQDITLSRGDKKDLDGNKIGALQNNNSRVEEQMEKHSFEILTLTPNSLNSNKNLTPTSISINNNPTNDASSHPINVNLPSFSSSFMVNNNGTNADTAISAANSNKEVKCDNKNNPVLPPQSDLGTDSATSAHKLLPDLNFLESLKNLTNLSNVSSSTSLVDNNKNSTSNSQNKSVSHTPIPTPLNGMVSENEIQSIINANINLLGTWQKQLQAMSSFYSKGFLGGNAPMGSLENGVNSNNLNYNNNNNSSNENTTHNFSNNNSNNLLNSLAPLLGTMNESTGHINLSNLANLTNFNCLTNNNISATSHHDSINSELNLSTANNLIDIFQKAAANNLLSSSDNAPLISNPLSIFQLQQLQLVQQQQQQQINYNNNSNALLGAVPPLFITNQAQQLLHQQQQSQLLNHQTQKLVASSLLTAQDIQNATNFLLNSGNTNLANSSNHNNINNPHQTRASLDMSNTTTLNFKHLESPLNVLHAAKNIKRENLELTEEGEEEPDLPSSYSSGNANYQHGSHILSQNNADNFGTYGSSSIYNNCPFCNKTFKFKSNLHTHIKAVHKKIKPHVCGICSKSFSLKQNMKTHMKNIHQKHPHTNTSSSTPGQALKMEPTLSPQRTRSAGSLDSPSAILEEEKHQHNDHLSPSNLGNNPLQFQQSSSSGGTFSALEDQYRNLLLSAAAAQVAIFGGGSSNNTANNTHNIHGLNTSGNLSDHLNKKTAPPSLIDDKALLFNDVVLMMNNNSTQQQLQSEHSQDHRHPHHLYDLQQHFSDNEPPIAKRRNKPGRKPKAYHAALSRASEPSPHFAPFDNPSLYNNAVDINQDSHNEDRDSLDTKSNILEECGLETPRPVGAPRRNPTDGKDLIRCSKCSKTFTLKGNYNVHMRIVHEKLREFECPFCGKRFGLKANMYMHVANVHKNRSLNLVDSSLENCGGSDTDNKHASIFANSNNNNTSLPGHPHPANKRGRPPRRSVPDNYSAPDNIANNIDTGRLVNQGDEDVRIRDTQFSNPNIVKGPSFDIRFNGNNQGSLTHHFNGNNPSNQNSSNNNIPNPSNHFNNVGSGSNPVLGNLEEEVLGGPGLVDRATAAAVYLQYLQHQQQQHNQYQQQQNQQNQTQPPPIHHLSSYPSSSLPLSQPLQMNPNSNNSLQMGGGHHPHPPLVSQPHHHHQGGQQQQNVHHLYPHHAPLHHSSIPGPQTSTPHHHLLNHYGMGVAPQRQMTSE
ncbi:uncharacterized protein DDB_G0283357-like isoform X2 [Gordionus sp. m RMFG-2023]|uniref:uncharacterized protein DDB_G0283357-like isoform X2 n=1 Tax=Gordionus sp. m RMFG-2023 TaxID=3053472 RepID=UPI0031FC69CC